MLSSSQGLACGANGSLETRRVPGYDVRLRLPAAAPVSVHDEPLTGLHVAHVNAVFASGITKGLNPKADLGVEIDAESLDLTRLNEVPYADMGNAGSAVSLEERRDRLRQEQPSLTDGLGCRLCE